MLEKGEAGIVGIAKVFWALKTDNFGTVTVELGESKFSLSADLEAQGESELSDMQLLARAPPVAPKISKFLLIWKFNAKVILLNRAF